MTEDLTQNKNLATTSETATSKTSTSGTVRLSVASQQAIDAWLQKFPAEQRQSAIIAALSIVQAENGGWLTTELIDLVADYVGVTKIHAYEIATFYSMYELKPVGRHKICVCTNIACMLRGADDIVKHLQDKLQIGFGEITADGKFSLKAVECLAACGGAPMLQIGAKYYEDLTQARVDQILVELE